MVKKVKIPKVLFRSCADWEHIVISQDGILLSDEVEGTKLDVKELLEALAKHGIIQLELEAIED